MKNQRLKQFGTSLLVVLSLFASSVSACRCASGAAEINNHCAPQKTPHTHEAKAEEHSALGHSHEASSENHHDANRAGNVRSIVSSDECCCIQPSRKFFAKSEIIKIEKQAALLVHAARSEIELVSQPLAVNAIEFAAPRYLSDSFYNLTPGRAPPRL